MIQVLVDEQIHARLEVPAVGGVDVGAADGEVAQRETARVAAGGLEVVVRDVRCDEAVPVPGGCGEARASYYFQLDNANCTGLRHQPPCERDGRDTDREVDEKHRGEEAGWPTWTR